MIGFNVSEILQLAEIKCFLMALYHFHGMMEYWNIGGKGGNNPQSNSCLKSRVRITGSVFNSY
jgi:hypothetical protein